MSGTTNGSHTARWSRDQKDILVITDAAGNVVESHPARSAADRPGAQILWNTGWMAYPGTEWQEEPPGQWPRPVFPESEMSRKR